MATKGDAIRFLQLNGVIHRDIKPQVRSFTSPCPCPPAPTPSLRVHHAPLTLEPPPPTRQRGGSRRRSSTGNPSPQSRRFRVRAVVANARFSGNVVWLSVRWVSFLSPLLTLTHCPLSSSLYMAPEILRYEQYNARADLWSVGAVLYEIVLGRAPFKALNLPELIRKIDLSKDKIKFLSGEDEDNLIPINPPRDLKKLIRALLKKNPGERLSFGEFYREANDVAISGTAYGLLSAEQVRKRIEKLERGEVLDYEDDEREYKRMEREMERERRERSGSPTPSNYTAATSTSGSTSRPLTNTALPPPPPPTTFPPLPPSPAATPPTSRPRPLVPRSSSSPCPSPAPAPAPTFTPAEIEPPTFARRSRNSEQGTATLRPRTSNVGFPPKYVVNPEPSTSATPRARKVTGERS